MKVKVESEKVGLKLNIQKMKIMASGPITSWEIDGETAETESDTTEAMQQQQQQLMKQNKEASRQCLSEDGKDGGTDYKELEKVLGSDGYMHHLIVVMVSNNHFRGTKKPFDENERGE